MTVMPHGDNWTVADLAAIPDDGLQYELADGVLLVSPTPRPRHQVVVGEMHLLLWAACPVDLQVFLSPLDYQPTNRRSFQPDLLVVRRSDVGELNVVAPLRLAVEVLSPSTRSKDLLLKRGIYEQSGVGSYWIVDPDEPSVTALELCDGCYVEAGRVVGDEVLALELPFRCGCARRRCSAEAVQWRRSGTPTGSKPATARPPLAGRREGAAQPNRYEARTDRLRRTASRRRPRTASRRPTA